MSTADEKARRVITRMLKADTFSRWLGIEVLEIQDHSAVLRMRVRDDMLNGFGVAHGGIAYSLADSAFACACNGHGKVTVAVENTMRYPAAAVVGDVLTAIAVRDTSSRKLGYYRVTITNQRDETVALFTGTSYATSRPHFPDSPE